MKKLLVALLGALLVLSACSKDNTTEPEQQNVTDEFVTQNIKDVPTYFSIAKKEAVNTFDVTFVNEGQTLSVLLNGGISGSAGVSAKNLGAVDFNASANVDSGFASDAADAKVIGETWYNYDLTTHTITSKGDVYLIKAVDYNIYKMRIDAFGADGYTISYSLVDADGKPASTTSTVIAAAAGAPGLFSMALGDVIEKDEWDIAFLTISLYVPELGGAILNPAMRINSGAGVKIAVVQDMAYEDINKAPDGLTYVMDEGDNLAIGDKVLNYNSTNHRLTPPEVVYIVQTVDGSYAKVQVTSYYDPESGASGVINLKAAILN